MEKKYGTSYDQNSYRCSKHKMFLLHVAIRILLSLMEIIQIVMHAMLHSSSTEKHLDSNRCHIFHSMIIFISIHS